MRGTSAAPSSFYGKGARACELPDVYTVRTAEQRGGARLPTVLYSAIHWWKAHDDTARQYGASDYFFRRWLYRHNRCIILKIPEICDTVEAAATRGR